MMPLGDDNSQRRTTPYVTYALIAINILAFLVELQQPDIESFLRRWGTVPAQITHGEGYITLLTSMFLHGGWAHLLGNMLFLWTFGDNVEDRLGHGIYLVFYLLTGLAASLAQVFIHPSSTLPGVGASGAISGVLAAYILMFGSNAVRVLVGGAVTSVPAYLMIGLWIAMQFLNGFASVAQTRETGGVAYAAHIGGFIAGLILAMVLRGTTRPQLPGGKQRLAVR